jgi:hypothetical protein
MSPEAERVVVWLTRERMTPTDVGVIQRMRRIHVRFGGSEREPLYHTDGLPNPGGTLGAGGLRGTIRSLNINNVRRNTMR